MTAKQQRVFLERENRNWPEWLANVPESTWVPDGVTNRVRVLRSRRFMAQVFQEADGVLRMSVNRTELDPGGQLSGSGSLRWKDGITWDELQMLKAQAGYEALFAIEIYPPTYDVVNVANMRHLWILPEPLAVGWKRSLRGVLAVSA